MITTSKQVSKHFHSSEFRCQHCGRIYIDEALITKLEAVFSQLKASKCIISSGYRCRAYDIQIGGFAGRHSQGLAADCCFYDKSGKLIPSKIVCCVAWDLKQLRGIAKIDDWYVHLDNRPSGTYYGDEQKGNSSYWTNPYQYFKVSAKDVQYYTGNISSGSTKYQVHGLGTKWYSNVYKDTVGYAGVFGVAIDGLYIDNYTYKVKIGNKWLPEVKGRNDYAGILGSPIVAVAIKGCSYRVHIKGGKWLPYVTGYNVNDFNNGFAGNGKIIDAIQIK